MVVLFCLFVWGEGEDDIDFFYSVQGMYFYMKCLTCTPGVSVCLYIWGMKCLTCTPCFSMSQHLGDEVFDMYSMFEG